jgi:LGFP repeat/PKD domain
MTRTLVRLATAAGAVLALAVPVPQASAVPVEDQLTFVALKPDPASRTLDFTAMPRSTVIRDLAWSFGDGQVGTGYAPRHTFAAGESFTVRLTATFGSGAERTITKVVQPGGQPPQLQLTPPASDARFAAGEVVHASATAPDATEIIWATSYDRCMPACTRQYPDLVLGTEYAFAYPPVGISAVSVLVEAFATGTSGLSSRVPFTARPKTAPLVVSTPFPADIKINGRSVTPNLFSGFPDENYNAHVGDTLNIVASTTALSGAATFQSWNDGNIAATRQFPVLDQSSTLTADYLTPIEARYNSDAGLRSLLGPATQSEDYEFGSGGYKRYAYYRNGRLQWSPTTGVHEVHGGLNWVGVEGNYPITDELGTPDGVGRYNDFENRWSAYWTPSTGGHAVHGGIGDKWRQYGKEVWLGYPTTGELGYPDGTVWQEFSRNASIYWTAASGAHEMHGAINAKYNSFGGYALYGYPTTDESGTPDGVGRFNHFSRAASIYWTPSTGAHEVHGGIRTKWLSLGAERSFLGYPISDEMYPNSSSVRENFQGGYIVWNNATATATAYRY